MFKMPQQVTTETKLNNEGKEKMLMTHLQDFDARDPRIKLFSLIQVKPGQEVEYHKHVGESESYFFLSGKGIYNDNGTKVDIVPGMTTLTPSGESHSVKNTGDEDVVFIALIVKQ